MQQSLMLFAKRALKGHRNFDSQEIERVKYDIARIDGRCDWSVAHVYISEMIDSYARPGVDPEIIKVRAREFMTALDEYPTWAVIRSIRWWRSHENKWRMKHPQHGDISSICHEMTAPIRVSLMQIERLEK